ncbi:hypothetical protein LCGC14_2176140 [marine sediment metagenome]|uniref:Uncharacterized protein n=1 Tax=marine sediment metagenome TaxID=412755 RepID=A0A0F9DNL6_9ZZZZ
MTTAQQRTRLIKSRLEEAIAELDGITGRVSEDEYAIERVRTGIENALFWTDASDWSVKSNRGAQEFYIEGRP